MDWIQLATLFIANAALIFWMRGESRQDWRMMHEEMKDFHERLIRLEEKYLKGK